MSDNIPFDIQTEIIKRLPVKSLIQFQSVCKTWKTLITSSDFIKRHHTQVQHHHHLLVRYKDTIDYEHNYISFVDDHTFPQHKVSHTVPDFINNLINPKIIASSHGLLCLHSNNDQFVLWNVSIRKAIAVVNPSIGNDGIYGTAIGFGVCRETIDPKIVKITYVDQRSEIRVESETSCIAPRVEVFTLSAKVWRSSYVNLPRKSIHFYPFKGAVVNGIFYWLANDRITMDGEHKFMLVSFDMTSEEFGEVILPDSLARMGLCLSKLGVRESLVLVAFDLHDINPSFDVWMMGDGVSKSFTKLFTLTPEEDTIFKGFRKSGEPIIEIPEQEEGDCGQLAVYEPCSKLIDSLGIVGKWGTFDVYDYKETLLLLDQPNVMVYNGI
ncbi:F-box/kelch-repeat protein At3g23880-like [Bidens hawaiensis]|uniref:F-box/kelch-repeat protein At3g23880-like n=1 Tax=Bidens hawaiensis TaxID=980011 RepID=UPI00404AE975